MRKPKELKIERPELLTISDCLLAYQMGYRTDVAAGQFKGFKEEAKQ
jgi:hypothetical protein